MSVAAVALVLPAFVRPRRPPPDDSRRQNIVAAQTHLAEIKKLPAAQAEEYENEIKSRLLAEVEDSVAPAAADNTRRNMDKIGVVLIVVALLPGALTLYWHLGTPQAALSSSAAPNLQAALAGLELHIAQNPNDAKALSLMARTLQALGRQKEAADYFARAKAAEDANNQTP